MKTAKDYEAELKRIPQDADAMEEQDYQENVKAGLSSLTDDNSRGRARLAYRTGMAEGMAYVILSYARYLEVELEQRTLKDRDLPHLLELWAIEMDATAEDRITVEDAREWLVREGYIKDPQAPKSVLVAVGHDYTGEER